MNKIDMSKYIKAKFDTIWQITQPQGIISKWIVGFFCQGVESSMNDGLICYIPLEGKSEEMRDQHLSPVCDTIQEAIDRTFELYMEGKKEGKMDKENLNSLDYKVKVYKTRMRHKVKAMEFKINIHRREHVK